MKYLRSTTLGCKDIEIRKSEFVAKTQFLYRLHICDSDGLNFLHFLGYKYRLVSILRKRDDQALISISTILKFSTQVDFEEPRRKRLNFQICNQIKSKLVRKVVPAISRNLIFLTRNKIDNRLPLASDNVREAPFTIKNSQ